MADGRTRLSADVAARGAPALRRPRLRRGRPAKRAPRRGAEPRPSDHRVRPALCGRGRLLQGGGRACRPRSHASEPCLRRRLTPPRPGPRARGAARRRGRPRRSWRRFPSGRSPPNPRQPRRRMDADALGGARRVRARAGRRPAGRRPAARGRPLRAHRRRAPLARRPRRRPRDHPGARPRGRRPRVAPPRARRERRPRGPLRRSRRRGPTRSSRTSSRSRSASVAERVGRSKPTVSNRLRLLELPDDVLDLVERGSLTEGHARAVLAVPGNEERRALAREDRARGPLRPRGRARGPLGGRPTKPRRAAPVDPELAVAGPGGARAADRRGRARRRAAASRSPSTSETALAEIVEALERPAVTAAGVRLVVSLVMPPRSPVAADVIESIASHERRPTSSCAWPASPVTGRLDAFARRRRAGRRARRRHARLGARPDRRREPSCSRSGSTSSTRETRTSAVATIRPRAGD